MKKEKKQISQPEEVWRERCFALEAENQELRRVMQTIQNVLTLSVPQFGCMHDHDGEEE